MRRGLRETRGPWGTVVVVGGGHRYKGSQLAGLTSLHPRSALPLEPEHHTPLIRRPRPRISSACVPALLWHRVKTRVGSEGPCRGQAKCAVHVPGLSCAVATTETVWHVVSSRTTSSIRAAVKTGEVVVLRQRSTLFSYFGCFLVWDYRSFTLLAGLCRLNTFQMGAAANVAVAAISLTFPGHSMKNTSSEGVKGSTQCNPEALHLAKRGNLCQTACFAPCLQTGSGPAPLWLSERLMDPSAPGEVSGGNKEKKKIHFSVPASVSSQLDPRQVEMIRRRRPTPATLFRVAEQPSPEDDSFSHQWKVGENGVLKPKFVNPSVYQPPSLKAVQRMAQAHMQKLGACPPLEDPCEGDESDDCVWLGEEGEHEESPLFGTGPPAAAGAPDNRSEQQQRPEGAAQRDEEEENRGGDEEDDEELRGRGSD
ncbi:protein phosphatase 1 regulatory subunit 1B-like [Arapaima gigas]